MTKRRLASRGPADPRAAELARQLWDKSPMGPHLLSYLSTRLDLLPAYCAAALDTRAARCEPLEREEIRARCSAELGAKPEEVYAAFDYQALYCGPLVEVHSARRANGDPLLAKIARFDSESSLQTSLRAVKEPLHRCGLLGSSQIGPFLEDLHHDATAAIDLELEARRSVALAREVETWGWIHGPRVCGELSGQRWLTLEDPGGQPAIATETGPSREDRRGARWALRLCRNWLRLVLEGGLYPTAPRGWNLRLLADGGIVFLGGSFFRPSREAQRALWRYLSAVALGEAEAAVSAFLDLTRDCPQTQEDKLRYELRHATPFRDGGWDTDRDFLAHTLLVHWQRASDLDLELKPDLKEFFRGLAQLDGTCRRLSSEDSFRQALRERRLLSAADELRPLLDIEDWPERVQAQLVATADLPRKLDKALDLLASREVIEADEEEANSTAAQPSSSWLATLALLVLFVTAALLLEGLGTGKGPESDGAGLWTDSFSAGGGLALLALGAFLIKVAAGKR